MRSRTRPCCPVHSAHRVGRRLSSPGCYLCYEDNSSSGGRIKSNAKMSYPFSVSRETGNEQGEPLMVKSALLAAAATIGLSASALAETPQGAADQLRDFLNRFENLGPGYATVVVTADDVLLNHVSGERRASTGAPLTDRGGHADLHRVPDQGLSRSCRRCPRRAWCVLPGCDHRRCLAGSG